MTPSSPRQVGVNPESRSHPIQISPNASLSPSRTTSGPSHQGHRGSTSMAGRTYRDREDPESARERQMQQDIESAMSMSRARSGSMNDTSPPIMRPSQLHFPSTSPIDEHSRGFPDLSELEEADMDRARSAAFMLHPDDDHSGDGRHSPINRRESHEERGEGMGMADSRSGLRGDRRSSADAYYGHGRDDLGGGGRSHRRGMSGMVDMGGGDEDHEHDHYGHSRGHGHGHGMPRGGGDGKSHFSFGFMEEFAAKEREEWTSDPPAWSPSNALNRKLPVNGASGPNGNVNGANGVSGAGGEGMGPGGSDDQIDQSSGAALGQSYATGTTMERTHTMSTTYGEDSPALAASQKEEGNTFHRRRQRKLSQSNPLSRRQGKIALFEGFGNSPSTANQPNDINPDQSQATTSAFKAPRQPKNLSVANNGAGGGGFVPFTDSAPGHDRPYRFSFYSNTLPVTIHARTLAELPAEGQSFEELFKGKHKVERTHAPGTATEFTEAGSKGSGITTPNPVITRDHGYSLQDGNGNNGASLGGATGPDPHAKIGEKSGLLAKATASAGLGAGAGVAGDGGGGDDTLLEMDDDPESATWWLDVLSPTDDEMRMLSKVFGIHPLTTEDILLEETREKIELFRNYYLVCFRSFDQDPYSQTYLEPLNMYIIVFREGTLSFHFRGTPHPQNVRRRIKHLKDYISVTSDWISYALIDDITDAFGPLIQSIEYEVDSIDELVLILKEAEQSDMLRRIGTCRKKVMGLLRLMGNKADVVKGLAKRCNEQWLVAPKSDIGLYLSDIQDHLITMTQNLNHYEKILSRSHSNYLAQISIEMTDANNQINDVLSKLTALGTVLIPMNLVTGLWGMNVHVPGEDIKDGYAWFGGIVGAMALFASVGAFATWKCFVR